MGNNFHEQGEYMTVDLVNISKEELAALLRDIVQEEVSRKIDPLLNVIVLQQKDICDATGISNDTVRNKALRGELTVLGRDGSRLNYLTLKQAGELRPRKRKK